jgi:thiosulfate/3-mercaptopyruvate sulfurtransferase
VRIVSVEEAAALVAQGPAAVSVVDARDEGFAAGHLPRAQPMPWRAWTAEAPGAWSLLRGRAPRWGDVPEAGPALESRLRALGLWQGRPVLVVGAPHGWGGEGRAAWNLLYWGAGEVLLLDGGQPAWERAGGALERGGARPVPRGDFRLALREERRAGLAEVERAVRQGGVPLLDARSPGEWEGERVTAQRRGGRLPGARHTPHTRLYAEDGRFASADAVRALLGEGVSAEAPRGAAGQAPIAYCAGGVRSALLAVVAEARLGLVVRNYPGSLWEWGAREDLPLVGPREGGRR